MPPACEPRRSYRSSSPISIVTGWSSGSNRARGRRIGMSFSRPIFSSCCATGGASRARRDGCLPVSPGCFPATAGSIRVRASSTGSFAWQRGEPALPNVSAFTHCGTALPPISWSKRPISGSSRDAMGRAARERHHRRCNKPTGCPMPQPNDLSRSLAALDENSTLIAVIEMSQSSWLIAAIIPGVERHPVKKLAADEEGLLRRRHRWRGEAEKAGRAINRIAVAYEAGRDGFWLARWLRAHGIEAHVIHPNSIAVSREHRRAKTDRLDTALLKRAFLGWLRGERGHCSMAAIPSLEAEDAKRPSRERENLVGERTRIGNRVKSTLARLGVRGFKPTLRTAAQRLERLRTPEGEPVPPNTLAELRREMARVGLLGEQIREIETARLQRLEQQPNSGAHRMVRLLAQVRGLGIETADMLTNEA